MTVKVMISLPEEFLREVDRLARDEHRTRSGMVREAISFYMRESAAAGRRPIDRPEVREALEHMRSLDWKGKWDSTEEARKLRDKRNT